MSRTVYTSPVRDYATSRGGQMFDSSASEADPPCISSTYGVWTTMESHHGNRPAADNGDGEGLSALRAGPRGEGQRHNAGYFLKCRHKEGAAGGGGRRRIMRVGGSIDIAKLLIGVEEQDSHLPNDAMTLMSPIKEALRYSGYPKSENYAYMERIGSEK